MRAGIILQSRMASQRRPGKALQRIGGRPLVEHCLIRLLASETAPVILATTMRADDDAVADVGERVGVPVFRGAEDDVLDRFARCAEAFRLEVVIRATGDNPAVDIDAPSRLLSALRRSGAAYVREDGLPYGAAVEAVTTDALLRQARLARDPADREHVTTFVRRHEDQFTVLALPAPVPLARPDVRVTVDTSDDLQQMRRMYALVGEGLRPLSAFIHAWDRLDERSVA
jgi:spore coat polysaccharide biosynthesis protein SpsF (cytidylyltransferase family)